MQKIEDLIKENEELKNINSGKTELISISAHQLRTSLSALKWILKMFIDEDLGKLTNEQQNFINKAYSSNERMINLVNDLLTSNHTDDPTMLYNLRHSDVVNLIDETVFEFSGESNKKGVNIIFLKPESKIKEIYCDSKMMRVALDNILENAIKYCNRDDNIFISVKEKGDNVEISVRDTGIGIDENDKEEVFKKFFRAENAKQKESIGSGLGLFTTKNIIEKHNGKIWFESTKNHGTTFFISLPIK